ncbi:VOC family protein [Sulfitobacter sp. D35]|uniref:VOC family protein n=1 Tax=Sulfitobacter sp. D35 TaxID=3083252 RepID=UPI00296F238B|nr:VOC family protein [Sulfitobacter sp. D35]MDW4497435.1 VOC family protein [Sulfitobacter sp. D35]
MRLNAVSILVPDYASGLEFYVEKLGFSVVQDVPQGDKRWIVICPPGGGTKIVLAEARTARQRAAVGEQGGGRVWLFLETDDFARDHARFRAAEVAFEEEPRREPYGIVAVFGDPFGNRWDLIQYAPEEDANKKTRPKPGLS